jgi:hypothetical protein
MLYLAVLTCLPTSLLWRALRCSAHCPSTYLCQALFCSSRSLAGWTKIGQVVPVARFYIQLCDVSSLGHVFIWKYVCQSVICRIFHCYDPTMLGAEGSLRMHQCGKMLIFPRPHYLFDNIPPKKWGSFHLSDQVRMVGRRKVTLSFENSNSLQECREANCSHSWED